jgi:hypothetical protein
MYYLSRYNVLSLALLPFERRVEFAAYLPTTDFLASRFSSRVMTFGFHNPSFGKTRFQIVQDRGFLGYLVEVTDRMLDWQ